MAAQLDVVLDAARAWGGREGPEVEWILVGDGADFERLRQRAVSEGLTRVRFTGLVGKREVRSQLARADVCLVHLRPTPLFRTVLPSKMFESMAMGVPILMGVEGAASRLVESAGAGLAFTPGSPESLCEALSRLADNPDLRRRMGANGRRHILRRHDRRKLAKDYLRALGVPDARRETQTPARPQHPTAAVP